MEKLESLAARLELEQARRDYRATWPLFNSDAESSAWDYVGTAHNAWAELWDERDWWCDTHNMCEVNCSEMEH